MLKRRNMHPSINKGAPYRMLARLPIQTRKNVTNYLKWECDTIQEMQFNSIPGIMSKTWFGLWRRCQGPARLRCLVGCSAVFIFINMRGISTTQWHPRDNRPCFFVHFRTRSYMILAPNLLPLSAWSKVSSTHGISKQEQRLLRNKQSMGNNGDKRELVCQCKYM